MLRIFNAITGLIIIVILFCGCAKNKPNRDYTYISLNPIKGWENGILLNFNLELSDTANIYAIYFTTQIKDNQDINSISGFPVDVCIMSPKGDKYYNSVILPLNVMQKKKIYHLSNGVIEIEWPYLKNIKNKESGIWKLTLKQTQSANIYKNIIGFGASCKVDK
ncbi:MAG: hypothetical protein RR312_04250 [Bacteroidales bacterium]